MSPTPGPWYAEKSSADFWYITAKPGPFSPAIGQTWASDLSAAEVEANARLMAASSALYEALKLARCICVDAFKDTLMEWDTESMAIIDAAISEAEGRRA